MKKTSLALVCGLALCLAGNVQAAVVSYAPAVTHIAQGNNPNGVYDVYQMGMDNSGRALVNVSTYKQISRVNAAGVIDFDFVYPGTGWVGTASDPIQDAAGGYVVTTTDLKVHRFQSDGTLINSWSTAGYPGAVAEDDDGNIWTAEHITYPQSRLVQYDTAGNVLQTISTTQPGGLPYRWTIEFVSGMQMYDGLMYVLDAGRMIKFDPADPCGTMVEAVAANDYYGGNWSVSTGGFEIDASGRIYVVEYGLSPSILIHDAGLPANANYIQTITDPMLDQYAKGIGVDAAGTIYVGEDGGGVPNVMKFVVVPEPTTMILLGLGSVALLRRKRG